MRVYAQALCVAAVCLQLLYGAHSTRVANSETQQARLESDEVWFHLDEYLAQQHGASTRPATAATAPGFIEEQADTEAQDFEAHSQKQRALELEEADRTGEHQQLWFHLDDYVSEAEGQARQQEADKDDEMAAGDDERPLPKKEEERPAPKDKQEGMELNDKNGGVGDKEEEGGEKEEQESAGKEDQKQAGGNDGTKESAFSAAREFNGGATNVLANKNYMSVMENAEGDPISPSAAREEARLEARLHYKKKHLEEKTKSHSESGSKAVARQRVKDSKERGKKKAGEEVRKAQEAAHKTTEREKAEAAKKAEGRTREQNKKQEHHIKLKAPVWRQPGKGNSYLPARVDQWGRFCILSGMAYSSGAGGLMGVLPAKCRPSGRIMFTVVAGGRNARLDILPDGRMYIIWWAPRNQRWLSLSGIIYAPRSQGQRVPLVRHWRNYGGTWRPFGVTMQNNVVVLSGLIRGGQWNHFTNLPSHMRPVKRLIFSACNHQYITRVDVTNTGAVVRAGGGSAHHWVNLDGVVFSKFGGPKLKLHGNWKNYKSAFRHARAHRVGPLCLASGLIRNDARDWSLPGSHHVTTLPPTCRPAGDLLFGCNSHNPHWPVQLKVAPNGKVTYVGGRTGAPWVSLDCLHFVPKDAM